MSIACGQAAFAQPVGDATAFVLTQARKPDGRTGALHLHRICANGPCSYDIPLPLSMPQEMGGPAPYIADAGAEEIWIAHGDGALPLLVNGAPMAVAQYPELPSGVDAHALPLGYARVDATGVEMVLAAPGGGALVGLPRGRAMENYHPIQRALPGKMVHAVAFGSHCAALVHAGDTLSFVMLNGLRTAEWKTVELMAQGAAPVRGLLAASPHGRYLAAAVPSGEGSMRRETHVWAVTTGDGEEPAAVSLRALGNPLPNRHALHFSGPETLWLVTRSPETRDGYLTQWRLKEPQTGAPGEWEKTTEHFVRALISQALVAPTGEPLEGVALARQKSLAVWTSAGVLWEVELPQEATALAVHDGRIWCGAGNSLLVYAAEDGTLEHTMMFQTGHVISVAVLPCASMEYLLAFDADLDGVTDAVERENGMDPARPDSDGDGIPDGADPRPLAPSPVLEAPLRLVFSGRAAGRELRGMLLESPNGAPMYWTVDVAPPADAWLRVYPRHGNQTTPVYLGVDPVEARRGNLPPGVISISATDPATGDATAGSPARVEVSVSSLPRGPRVVLWMYPSGGGAVREADGALRRQLSAPPMYLSHRVHEGACEGCFDGVAAVVLSLEAAARGVVSQQAAADYVMRGGALLLAVEHMPADDVSYLRHWGEPLGLMLDGQGGVSLEDGEGACDRREVGAGRVAVWRGGEDSATPELFDWLLRAGRDIADLDADGLPDALEDRNGNQARDAGETSSFKADSDGDGLPDGIEDANRNGLVDAGETDPLREDSDGDGIWDGADTD